MAKKAPPVSAKSAARALRRGQKGPTFIQRSRAVASEEKAIFHNVTGAGKSRIKRRFMDMGDAEIAKLREALGGLVLNRLRKQAG